MTDGSAVRVPNGQAARVEHTIDYGSLIDDDRVHGSLYSDPQVFVDEMERIFTRGWVFVGHESEISEPGAWITRTIGLEPMIMVRDRDGGLHVLANRCSHRGTALCWEASGCSKAFQCTYHGWTFSLSGELRGVPQPGGFHKDRAELGLDRAGQVESYRGFVFANPSGEAGPLADHLGRGGMALLDRTTAMSPVGKLRISAGWLGQQVDSNWKMWPESDHDGYHVDWVHASMARAVPDNQYQSTVMAGEEAVSSVARDHGLGHIELDFRPGYDRELAWLGVSRDRVQSYVDALVDAYGPDRAEQIAWDGPPHALIFPNLFLGEMNLAIIQPLAPDLTVHHHTPLFLEGVDEGLNRRILRQSEAAMGPASFLLPDNAVTAERMQAAFAGAVARSERSDVPEHAWIDLSRGARREQVDADGHRFSHISDETTNRGFWQHYRHVMSSR